MNVVDSLQSRMEQLRAQFLERCLADLDALDELILASPDLGSAHAVTRMQELAHRMAGAGATLGYGEISEGARKIEGVLRGLAEDNNRTLARSALHVEIRQLRVILGAIRAGH